MIYLITTSFILQSLKILPFSLAPVNKNSSDMQGEGRIDARVEFVESKEFVLNYINEDIEEFEVFKSKIAYLEKHLEEHADRNIIDTEELVDTNDMLKELDLKGVEPFEKNLIALRNQFEKLNDSLDEDSMAVVLETIEKAEEYIDVVKERMEDFDALEQEWESKEETEIIQNMLESNKSKSRDFQNPESI